MKNTKCFSCSNASFFWSDETFYKISLVEFISKRLWIKMTGFLTPIYFINESIILKNESFCVVCIIVSVYLLFKDGSNNLNVIVTCILLFTLFRCCCISIIVLCLTRWIGWLKQQQWPKIRFTFFLFCNTTS